MIQFDSTITLDGLIGAAITFVAVLFAWWLGINQEKKKEDATTIEIFSHLRRLILETDGTNENFQLEIGLLRVYSPIMLSKFGCFLFPEGTEDEKLRVGNAVPHAPRLLMRIILSDDEIVDVGASETRIAQNHFRWARRPIEGNPFTGYSVPYPMPLTEEERKKVVKDIDRLAKSHGLKTSRREIIKRLKRIIMTKKQVKLAINTICDYFHSLVASTTYDLTKIPPDIMAILSNMGVFFTNYGEDPRTATPGVSLMEMYAIRTGKINKRENKNITELPVTDQTFKAIWGDWVRWMGKNITFLKEFGIKLKEIWKPTVVKK